MNTLLPLSDGMTNYVSVHNSNYSTIQGAVDAVQAALSSATLGQLTQLTAYVAILGPAQALVGSGSYAASTSGTVLTLQGGYVWRPDLPMVLVLGSPATIDFNGQPGGTYYITTDATGVPIYSSSSSVFDIYQVDWDGTAVFVITRLIPIVWNFQDDALAQESTTLGHFDSLDGRLEAIETALAGAGTGTVTTVSVATANGVSGSVTNATTTPAITLTLGAITPSTVNGMTITANSGTLHVANAKTFDVLHSLALDGTDGTTMTFPGTSDTVVTLAASQTLTNKTLTNAVVGTQAPGDNSTKAASTAYADAAVAAGTSGLGSGTVTHTAGSLTSNAVVLGAGSADTKVVAGFSTDGASVLTLGVAGTSAGGVDLKNATSGTLSLRPPTGALGTVTLTLPAATDTLVGRATTDTLTNKTLDTAGTGNVFKINGTGITDKTGTGKVVLDTSPTFTTPALGTPSALVLTNATGATGANWGTQTANTVLSGPTSGGAANPAFRALVAADLPAASAIASPAFASTLTLDLSTIKDGGIFRVTLTGAITLQLSNGTDGQKFILELTQDGTGTRLVTLGGSYFKFGTDITSFTATTTASKKDRVGCIATGATTADVLAVQHGY